jgi:hypothetical protein
MVMVVVVIVVAVVVVFCYYYRADTVVVTTQACNLEVRISTIVTGNCRGFSSRKMLKEFSIRSRLQIFKIYISFYCYQTSYHGLYVEVDSDIVTT